MPSSREPPTQGVAHEVEPYLFLNGRCDEAIQFYQAALGAKTLNLMRFKDNPEPAPPESFPGGVAPDGNSVMHASLRIGDTQLMLSDGMPGSRPEFKGFSLTIGYAQEAQARKAFDALAEGGRVEMPLGKTFFSPCFGMTADRFGVSWMVMVDDGAAGPDRSGC